MVNEAVRELVRLPKYTAYVKVLDWTGRIETLEVPEACWNLEIAFPDRRYYRKRTEIEAEITDRQEGWRPSKTGETLPVQGKGEGVAASPEAGDDGGADEPPPQFS